MSRASSMRCNAVLGSVLCVALLGAACGGSGSSGSATTTTVKYVESEGVASPAAALRADLTAVFQEHVLLTGITTAMTLAGQDATPAMAVLDQNSAALGTLLSGYYGDKPANEFLALWRQHDRALVAFSALATSDDKAKVTQAKADITAIETEIIKVLNTTNVQLTPAALTLELNSYASKLEATITAQAKHDPLAPTKLKEAADTMSSTAIVFAAAIIKDKKDAIAGKLDAVSAVLRTTLTAKLQEHVYLAGLATGSILAGRDVKSDLEALDANSVEISEAISAIYGETAGEAFLKLWRQHISLFVDFTRATSRKDAAAMATARTALDGYSGTLATFLGGANPKLEKAALAADLTDHINSLLVVIEAQAAKDPSEVNKLREAAMHMPGTALLLATAVAQQFPVKFG